MSQRRTAKIDGELQRLLGEIFLTEMKDPRFSKMAGVTRVAVTPGPPNMQRSISAFTTRRFGWNPPWRRFAARSLSCGQN